MDATYGHGGLGDASDLLRRSNERLDELERLVRELNRIERVAAHQWKSQGPIASRPYADSPQSSSDEPDDGNFAI